jgi:uncharacterized membrane protein
LSDAPRGGDRRHLHSDWGAALAVGLIEPAVQTLAFLIHERVWARIEARKAMPEHNPAT